MATRDRTINDMQREILMGIIDGTINIPTSASITLTDNDVQIVDASGNALISQKTKAGSLPVTLASDEDPITTELTALQDQTVHYVPVKQIETWTISGAITGVITSITNTVTIAGAVTNAVLTAVYDGVNSLRVVVTNTVAATNNVLTDIWDSVNHRIKVNIENASLPVTGTFWQATQPVSGTVTATPSGTQTVEGAVTTELTALQNQVVNYVPVKQIEDVGITGLKMVSNGVNVTCDTQPKAVAVTAGAELCSVENQSITATMYVGYTVAQGAEGIRILPGVIRHGIKVTGLANIYIYSTVISEVAGVQFDGRS